MVFGPAPELDSSCSQLFLHNGKTSLVKNERVFGIPTACNAQLYGSCFRELLQVQLALCIVKIVISGPANISLFKLLRVSTYIYLYKWTIVKIKSKDIELFRRLRNY